MVSIICINLCKDKPTVNELADIMGSSHQNVKQILLKLEKKGFVYIAVDENDKRKQRRRHFLRSKCKKVSPYKLYRPSKVRIKNLTIGRSVFVWKNMDFIMPTPESREVTKEDVQCDFGRIDSFLVRNGHSYINLDSHF